MIITSINTLDNNFKSYLQAQNSKINAYAPYSFWDIFSGAISAQFLDLYGSLQLINNAIFPQNAVGDQVDLWLFREGLPSRVGATYATVQVILQSGSSTTLSVGQEFTSQTTGNVWKVQLSQPISTTVSAILYAQNPGDTYIENVNDILTGNNLTLEVQSCTSGSLEETDQSCINRILQAARAPIAGARSTDYAIYCLQASTQVTDSIIIPSFSIVNNVGILGVIPLVGTPLTNYQLDQGLATGTFFPYSRQASTQTLTTVSNYIQNLRLVGLSVTVVPCITYNTITISATVALVEGYSLSTQIQIQTQDANNNPTTETLTVQQTIQRSIRQAIVSQPFGGTIINGNNYITLESIITFVNTQLGYLNGQLAQILTNLTISGGDISVPSYNTSVTELQYTYDVSSYNDITITLQ